MKIPKDWQYYRADQFYKFGRKGLLFVWRIDEWVSSSADKSEVRKGRHVSEPPKILTIKPREELPQ